MSLGGIMTGWMFKVHDVPKVPETPLQWMSNFRMEAADVLDLVIQFGLTLRSRRLGSGLIESTFSDWKGNVVYTWYGDLCINRVGKLPTGGNPPSQIVVEMSEFVLQRHCDAIALPTTEVSSSTWVFVLTQLAEPGKRFVILEVADKVKMYLVPEIIGYPRVVRAINVFELWFALTGYKPE